MERCFISYVPTHQTTIYQNNNMKVLFLLFLRYFELFPRIIGSSAGALEMQFTGRLGKFEKFGCYCPQYKKRKIILEMGNVTIIDSVFRSNLSITVLEDIPETNLVYGMRVEKCRNKENLDSCQEFADFQTNKFCSIVSSGNDKMSYFSFATDLEPPLRCPMRKGVYRKETQEFDIKKFPIPPIFNGYYWRILMKITKENLSEILMCCNFETTVHFVQRLNVLYEKNWTRLVTEQLKRFERAVVESGKNPVSSQTSQPGPRWTFAGALLYCLTLLTTVGHARLSPRTQWGKVASIIYAVVGVPLMLVLLSALGSALAFLVRAAYMRACCKRDPPETPRLAVGYHKAPSSPPGNRGHNNRTPAPEDTALIQLHTPIHRCPNGRPLRAACLGGCRPQVKRTLLATVRSAHMRGCPRPGPPVMQMLPPSEPCGARRDPRGTPTRGHGGHVSSDVDVEEDSEDNEHSLCPHSTPSRIPLLPTPPSPQPPSRSTVPPLVAFALFTTYLSLGAALLVGLAGYAPLDALHCCFLALSTIGAGWGAGATLPPLAAAAYLLIGLAVVAACFSLIHEEASTRWRRLAGVSRADSEGG